MTNIADKHRRIEMDEIDLSQFQSSNPQTWLYTSEYIDANLFYPDLELYLDKYKTVDQNCEEYKILQEELFLCLDNAITGAQKQKFDSRTYTRSKKKNIRPSLPMGMMSNLNNSFNLSGTETITKHSRLRMVNETFSYRDSHNNSLSNDMDSSIDDDHHTSMPECNETYQIINDNSTDNIDDLNSTFSYSSKPISFNFQEPVHNMHSSFNTRFAGLSNAQIDSFTNMSPPSLVSSIAMDGSGTFNSATFSRQGSVNLKRDISIDGNDDNDDQTAHNSLCSSMSTSILDEKEMSTSFLSQSGFPDNESSVGNMSPSMIDSFNFNNINTSMYGSTGFHTGRDPMENSMISSMTFNNMIDSTDEKISNGKSNFHLRKSFLKTEPGDQEISKYLTMNKKSQKGDLSLLAEASFSSSFKHDLNNTIKLNDSAEKYSDSFLLTDKMTDSFIKCTDRESLNITSKHPTNSLNVSSSLKQIDNQDIVLLPNQILNQNSLLSGRKSNGTPESNKNSPRRNATFRKISPSSDTIVVIDDLHNDKEIIDSNKESYINSMQSSIENKHIDDISSTPQNSSLRKKDASEKQYFDGRTMTGSSSDSLEGSSCSERSPPKPTTVPLCMDDLEYLAHKQHQSLLLDISTPLSKSNKPHAQFYQENILSPILSHSRETLSSSTYSNKSNTPIDSNKYGTYRLNSSSTGSLNRMTQAYADGGGSPRRLSHIVKRESSAPEIAGMEPPNRRGPFVQRFSANMNQRVLKQDEKYGSDGGLHYPRRIINNSPKFQYTKPSNQLPSYNRTLVKYRESPQLSGSTTELRPRQCGLPASKLRQYSSHKELNRISAPLRTATSNLQQRSRLHASNPALCPIPLTRQGSYTITPKDQNERRDFVKPIAPAREVNKADLGRIGTQVTNNHNNIGSGIQYGQPLRSKNNVTTLSSGINKINAVPNTGITNQSYIKIPSKPVAAQSQIAVRPAANPPGPPPSTANTQRLPRPSGLPRPASGIPRKSTLRPPSTYSLAPRPNDQTDCY